MGAYASFRFGDALGYFLARDALGGVCGGFPDLELVCVV